MTSQSREARPRLPSTQVRLATKSNTTRAAEVLGFTKVINGINIHVTAPILLGGQSTTGAQLVTVFTAANQAATDLEAAKAAYQQKLAAQRAAFAIAKTTEAGLKSYVQGAYGKGSAIVVDFGWSVFAAPVKTAQVKADAVTKSAATRKERHTMGSKQKSSIHGVVATPDASPAVAAATPVASK